jgi:hypothetical protein
MELKGQKKENIAIIETTVLEYRQCKEEWSQLFNKMVNKQKIISSKFP